MSLTCSHCNPTAGHAIDAAVHAEEVVARLLQRGGGSVRAVLQVGGETLRVEVDRTDHTRIQVVGKANNPRVVAQVQDYLRSVQNPEIQLVHRSQYTRRAAEVGLLKTAYLGAFTKFGYRYILRQCFNLVRQQIREPQAHHIEAIRIWVRDPTLPNHALLLFHAPVKCVGAKVKEGLVLLPWLEDTGKDHWGWLREVIGERTLEQLGQGKLLAWPQRLEMMLGSAPNES